MTALFGYCQSTDDTKPDPYHGLCEHHSTDQYGIEHVCGCDNHRFDSEES